MNPIVKAFAFALCLASPAAGDPVLIADFSRPGEAERWRFFTDGVMGGISEGQAVVRDGALVLAGIVSTANRGGFIQVRLDDLRLPADATRLVAQVRGDGQVYYLHLRTTATRLPWQYYQAAFTAARDWTEVTVPLTAFAPSGGMLPGVPDAAQVRSVALVAYGRDHRADVSLSRLRAE